MEDAPTHRFQVLALSGGGYRGLFTARVLADLEDFIGTPIATRFDLLAGTSIGGILALALAMEIPAADMVKFFETKGSEIFKSRWNFRGLLRAPYTQAALSDLLAAEDLFGERLLGEAKHRVIVPAINYSSGQPVVFKTPHSPNLIVDHRHRLVDVALATSAAPGYFPRHSFNDSQYVDGGLFANAPGLLGLHEAEFFLAQSPANVHLVSIGTMSARFTVDPRRNRQGGTLDWGGWNPANTPKRLFGVAISAQESIVDSLLQHKLGDDRYHHVDELLTDEKAGAVALDRTDAAAREALLSSAKDQAKRILGKEAFRTVLAHQAPEPVFHHGPRATASQP